jgi:hypothetical protein
VIEKMKEPTLCTECLGVSDETCSCAGNLYDVAVQMAAGGYVEAKTYGRPSDPFVRVYDRVEFNENSEVINFERSILARGQAESISVDLGIKES